MKALCFFSSARLYSWPLMIGPLERKCAAVRRLPRKVNNESPVIADKAQEPAMY